MQPLALRVDDKSGEASRSSWFSWHALRCTTWTAEVVRRCVLARHKDMLHLAWYATYIESYREINVPQLRGCTYLDYAGAALCSRIQLEAATAMVLQNAMANPHTSAITEEFIARARDQVLGLFGASNKTHTVIFTSNATQGLQLVGEHFSWSPGGIFLYGEESHTSVLGLRECARRAGVNCGLYGFDKLSLLCDDLAAADPLTQEAWQDRTSITSSAEGMITAPHNLLAITGESNFSGVKTELSSIAKLRDGPLRWRVLLDASKLACSPGDLDLSMCPADFTVMSFYKIFGYPTGLGALIVRHDAAFLLNKPKEPTYFGGGSVASVSATSTFVVQKANLAERLERGTPHFLGIAALPAQIQTVRDLGTDQARQQHALAVCREAYLRMRSLHHKSGRALCRIFGNHAKSTWSELQGPIIAFLMYFADGSPVPYQSVLQRAADRSIMLRAGCHCNVGACQRYLTISDADVRSQYAAGKVCGDDLGILDGRPTGAIRISFGLFSTLADVTSWIALLQDEFLDQLPLASGETKVATDIVPTTLEARLTTSPSGSTVGHVVDLKIYPIKGCGPLRVRRWPIDPISGALLLDRRWCLRTAPAVGHKPLRRASTISAKQAPRLTQVRFALRNGKDGLPELVLSLKQGFSGWQKDLPGDTSRSIRMPLAKEDIQLLMASGAEAVAETKEGQASFTSFPNVGGQTILANEADNEASYAVQAARWFEALLDLPSLQLVTAHESAGTGETPPSAQHFANAPSTLLLVSTNSLREFGRLCGLAAPADRFRANLEVELKHAFAEAEWPQGQVIQIGSSQFEAAGRCVRCQAVDIDPDSGETSGPSLLAALATARPGGGKGPTFGVLLRHECCSAKTVSGPTGHHPASAHLVLTVGDVIHTDAS